MSSIEIDGMPLIKHERDPDTGATKEIRSVYNIAIEEKRRIVEHKIPGLSGNILQDLGRDPVKISFEGVFYGETARDDLESLRAKFKNGEPVPFLSNITDIAEVTQVLIEELHVNDLSSVTTTYKYSISLREYIKPEEQEEKPPPSQEEEAKEETKKKSDEASESTETYAFEVLDPETNEPLKNVPVRIVWDEGEKKAQTDENGVVEVNLEPGTYKIIAEAPGYEKAQYEVVIPGPKEHTVRPHKEYFEYTITVTDTETGEPVEGATVRLLGEKDRYTLVTGKDGRAQERVKPGTYTLIAEASGYESTEQKDYQVDPKYRRGAIFLSKKRRAKS